MEKEGYIKVKELSKGVESITEMKKDHPELVNYDIFYICFPLWLSDFLKIPSAGKFKDRKKL